MTFSSAIISWFKQHKRDLPWRNTKDPYVIWLSEIILQQTRVKQGLPYFENFKSSYSTVEALAEASEDDVMKLWQGLGYYSRARNMHRAAKVIVEQHGGKFPDNYNDLLHIPGIGPYTAAAIASFAYNEKIAVVDGNVYRVLSRYLHLDWIINTSTSFKKFQQVAMELMSSANPADFNQSMMELGALVCTPQKPACIHCPVHATCLSFKHHNPSDYPKKVPKKSSATRYLNYVVLVHNNQTIVTKRTANDIWKNLWEFPVIESNSALKDIKNLLLNEEVYPFLKSPFTFKGNQSFKHKLTHQNILASFWIFEVKAFPPTNEKLQCVEIDKININFALSRLTEKFVQRYF